VFFFSSLFDIKSIEKSLTHKRNNVYHILVKIVLLVFETIKIKTKKYMNTKLS